MNIDAVLFVSQNLTDATEELVVTSTGGDEGSAMEVAKLIEAQEIRLVVDQACWGPCATYLVLTAQEVHVNENSAVFFGYSLAAMDYYARDREWPELESAKPILAAAAAAQRDFLSTRGVSPDWLIEGTIRLEPACIVRSVGTQMPLTLEMRANKNFWWPHREMVERNMRGKLTGFWPTNVITVDRAWLTRHMNPARGRVSLSLGGNNRFHPEAWGFVLKERPFCE